MDANEILRLRQVISRISQILPECQQQVDEMEEVFGFLPHIIMPRIADVVTQSYGSKRLNDADIRSIMRDLCSYSSYSSSSRNVVAISFMETAEEHEAFYDAIKSWLPELLG